MQKRAGASAPQQPSKAQERAAERRRAAELQAAHRFALKHVKARVRREDVKNVGAGLGSQTSQESWRRGSRPEAPAFAIPALSVSCKIDADACPGGAFKHLPTCTNDQGGVQQRVQVKWQVRAQGAGASQCHGHGPVSQAAGAGIGSAVGGSRGGLKQRRAGSIARKSGLGAPGVRDREDPVVQIFVPRCSPPSQAGTVCGVRASKLTARAVSATQDVVPEVIAAKRRADVAVHVDQVKVQAHSLTAGQASSDRAHDPGVASETAGKGVDTGTDGCGHSAVVMPSEVGVRCQEEPSTEKGAGCLTRSKQGADRGRKVAGCMKGRSYVQACGKGAGSAPGRLPSGPRKSTSGSRATAARVEELRIRLEAQLGPEKLLAACQCLDSDTITTSADGLPRQLEAVLAPQTHFAYAVYRLKMMEDIVFR